MTTFAELGLSQPVLDSLAHLGYVQQVGRQFRLTAKVLSLGGAYFDSMSLAGLAQPILHDLAEQIEHACSLTVLDGNDVVYLAHVMSTGGPVVSAAVSMRVRASRTASRRSRARGDSCSFGAVDWSPVRVSSSVEIRSVVTCQAPAT